MTFEELENGQVLIVEEINTGTQKVIVQNHYDMKYHTRLFYLINTIRCEVFNYLGDHATDFNSSIIFEYNGEQIPVQAENGVAVLSFEGVSGDEYTVRTANEQMRNGVVTFRVE